MGNTKLIQTKDYLLLIDNEAEIKGKGWRVDLERNSLGFIDSNEYYNRPENRDKFGLVIAYYPLTKEAEELDLPLLPNPFEKVDVKKLADKEIPYNPNDSSLYQGYRKYELKGFIKGYKSAQSKQFSLEDINKAMLLALDYGYALRSGSLNTQKLIRENFLSKKHNELIIKSLSTQQLPVSFEPEYEDYRVDIPFGSGTRTETHKRLKTTTNSEGKKVLIGEYKY